MKILIITSKSYHRIDGGDSKRLLELVEFLKSISAAELELELITSSSEQNEDVIEYELQDNILVRSFKAAGFQGIFFHSMKLLNPLFTLQSIYFWNRDKVNYIKKSHQEYDLILVHHLRNAFILNSISETKPILVELTDSISMTYDQLFDDGKITFRKLLFLIERFFVMRAEKELSGKEVMISLISKIDAEYFVNKFGAKPENIGVLPNNFLPTPIRCNFELVDQSPRGILFLGAFTSLQNVSGFRWFYEEIFCKNSALSKFILVVVGKGSERFSNLHGVKSYGFVEDLSSVIEEEKVFCGIAPLLVAGGQQNKIVDYNGLGLPVISTYQSSKWLRKLGCNFLEVTDDPLKFANFISDVSTMRQKIFELQSCELRKASDNYQKSRYEYRYMFLKKIFGRLE